jgi:hypothetical protein
MAATFFPDYPLLLRPLGNREWRIEREFRVQTEAAGLVIVPEGFVCDLNSIPRFLWWASTPSDYAEAGVAHDWAYRDQHLPRHIADAMYAEILTTMGMDAPRVRARYRALRLFGWAAYNN